MVLSESAVSSNSDSTSLLSPPPSLPLHKLLTLRQEGRSSSLHFVNRLYQKRSLHPPKLSQQRILQSSDSRTDTAFAPSSIESLDLSYNERFLLSGRLDGSLLLHDLSKWGRDDATKLSDVERIRRNHGTNTTPTYTTNDTTIHYHSPVAQVEPCTPPLATNNHPNPNAQQQEESHERFPGHWAAIRSARWCNAHDTGAFLSSSADGRLLIWDTQVLAPVTCYVPFRSQPELVSQRRRRPLDTTTVRTTRPTKTRHAICCMEVNQWSMNSVALSSPLQSDVKVMDIRSGIISHTLVGHDVGVLSLQWSPASEYVLATGGANRQDCCVRLWDIRKAGSHACLAILDQDKHFDPVNNAATSYRPHYGHIRQKSKRQIGSPNNYGFVSNNGTANLLNDHTEGRINTESVTLPSVTTCDRPIQEIAFDPSGHFLLVHDGVLHLWDLRPCRGGAKVPRRFLSPTGTTRISTTWSSARNRLRITSNGDGDCTIWTSYRASVVGYSLKQGGKPKHTLRGHLSPVTGLVTPSASPWTNMLISTGDDGLILKWDPEMPSKPKGTIRRSGKRKREDTLDQDNW